MGVCDVGVKKITSAIRKELLYSYVELFSRIFNNVSKDKFYNSFKNWFTWKSISVKYQRFSIPKVDLRQFLKVDVYKEKISVMAGSIAMSQIAFDGSWCSLFLDLIRFGTVYANTFWEKFKLFFFARTFSFCLVLIVDKWCSANISSKLIKIFILVINNLL